MAEIFGTFLADGTEANIFRFNQVEPRLDEGAIVFDFRGVENMTDSFANACFGNLFFDRFADFEENIRFTHCSDLIRDCLLVAISLAIKERQRGPQLPQYSRWLKTEMI